MFDNEFTMFIAKVFGYSCLVIILINIIFYEKPNPHVVHTHCTVEKCRNETFKESEFCYWHHPLRQIFYPLGSEMTPRRSQRIAEQQGYMYTFGTD